MPFFVVVVIVVVVNVNAKVIPLTFGPIQLVSFFLSFVRCAI